MTLRPQRTRATIANARGIQDPQGAIALRTPLLGIEGVTGRTAERPIRLRGKRRTRKAMRKGWAGPLGRAIDHGRYGLFGRRRLFFRGGISLKGTPTGSEEAAQLLREVLKA